MRTRLKAAIVAGVFLTVTVIPATTLAGPRGGRGGGTVQRQTQIGNLIRHRERVRDGSCLNAAKVRLGAVEEKGNAYGPGDGTGNETRPQDGTGYGAPSQR